MLTEEKLKSEIMVLMENMPKTKEELSKLKGKEKCNFYYNFGVLSSAITILNNDDSKKMLKSWLSDVMLSEV